MHLFLKFCFPIVLAASITACSDAEDTGESGDFGGKVELFFIKDDKRNEDESDDEVTSIGTLATSEEMCEIFEHPIFSRTVYKHSKMRKTEYDGYRGTEGYHVFPGAQESGLWIAKTLAEKELRPYANLTSESLKIADARLRQCFINIVNEDLDQFYKIETWYLPYLKLQDYVCISKNRRENEPCVDLDDFGVGAGSEIWYVEDPDRTYKPALTPTNFLLMLIWKDAHNILKETLSARNDEIS